MKNYAPFLFLTLILSCSHSAKVSTPAVVQKKADASTQESIIDESVLASGTEIALGESIASKLGMKYKILPISAEFQTYANDIAKKIAENSHRPSVQYQLSVLQTKELIAVGAPGGHILISKGFLEAIQTEHEFANLLANEIAHIAKQHLIITLIHNVIYAKSLEEGNITDRIAKQAWFEIFDQGYSYDAINEADRLAPTYAMHAGYNVQGLLVLLQRVQATMEKKRSYGWGDLDADRLAHRVSMNQIFVKSLDKVVKTSFPKAEDKYKAMLKKLPAPVKR